MSEAQQTGFFKFKQSRTRDADAHADYTICTEANMLIDRMTPVARELVDIVRADGHPIEWQIGENLRATEFMVGEYLALRLKRVKRKRGGRSTGVQTDRRKQILAPDRLHPGQMILPGAFSEVRHDDGRERLWLTAAFDLDDLDEKLTQRSIGVETKRRFLWKWPLPDVSAEAIANICRPLADRVEELRIARMA